MENKKQNKIILIVVIAIIAIFGIVYVISPKILKNPADESEAVKVVITNFGNTLKNVSLLSPTAGEDIEKNYKEYLESSLLEVWKSDPSKALGRLTSSPWPERIEIVSVNRLGTRSYDVIGNIINMTSVEQTKGGNAGLVPIDIGITKFSDKFLITGVTIGQSNENESWVASSANGVSFQYPEKLGTTYISPVEWPPVIKESNGKFSCTSKTTADGLPMTATQKTIADKIYCVGVENEGAAGSTYTTYSYVTSKGNKLVEIDFVLRFPQCANYDEPNKTACTSERESFNIDSLVNSIFQTVK